MTGALGKNGLRSEKPKQRCIPRKPRQLGLSAEIEALAVDTRTAVRVSTAEKIVLRETQKFSRKFGVVSAPLEMLVLFLIYFLFFSLRQNRHLSPLNRHL